MEIDVRLAQISSFTAISETWIYTGCFYPLSSSNGIDEVAFYSIYWPFAITLNFLISVGQIYFFGLTIEWGIPHCSFKLPQIRSGTVYSEWSTVSGLVANFVMPPKIWVKKNIKILYQTVSLVTIISTSPRTWYGNNTCSVLKKIISLMVVWKEKICFQMLFPLTTVQHLYASVVYFLTKEKINFTWQ